MDLGSGVAYGCAGTLCAFGKFLNDYASALTFLVGAGLGLGTFLFNIYWKFRQEKQSQKQTKSSF